MGYLNEPEITQKSFDNEGYFRTGDIGEYSEEFGYRITGRIKVSHQEIVDKLSNSSKSLGCGHNSDMKVKVKMCNKN